MKNQNPAPAQTKEGTHSTAKVVPNIRIVHIQTPDIVEIEPADFQKFAQSLTGKSTETYTEHAPINLGEESSNLEICYIHNSSTTQAHKVTANTKNKATNLKKPKISEDTTTSLATPKGSYSIAQKKPQFKIVHKQTPEIIEIKPADFQNLVQSLTGNKREISSREVPITLSDESLNTEMQIQNEFPTLESRDRKTTGKEEMTSWMNLIDESLINHDDLDKFINELITFPLFPLE